MMMRGATNTIIGDVLDGMITSFSDDLGVYMVRYVGLLFLITIFAGMRKRVHKPRDNKPKGKGKGKPVLA